MTFRSIQHYTNKETPRCDNSNIKIKPASFEDVSFAPKIFLVGLLISGIISILEFFTFQMNCTANDHEENNRHNAGGLSFRNMQFLK